MSYDAVLYVRVKASSVVQLSCLFNSRHVSSSNSDGSRNRFFQLHLVPQINYSYRSTVPCSDLNKSLLRTQLPAVTMSSTPQLLLLLATVLLGVCFVSGQAGNGVIIDGSAFASRGEKNFTSILAIDGGGARSVFGVMSLLELENAIKRYILTSRPETLPEGSEISSIDDFDVLLADFVDVISGSAFGSWISMYLATKGSSGSLRDMLMQPDIIERYGSAVPGSARALIVFFNEFMTVVYPALPAPPPVEEGAPPPPPPTSGPGITEPLRGDEGAIEALDALLGNSTLLDQQTTCLNPVISLETGAQITFITDHFESEVKIGYNSFSFMNPSDPLQQMQSADTQFTSGVDFRLADVALACSAGPTQFPATNVTSVSDPETRFLVADGFLGISGNPSFLGLGYAGNQLGTNSVEKFSILSIGQGNTVGVFADNANGGVFQWVASTEIINIPLFLGGDDFGHQLEFLYSANPNVEFLQYLRIQAYAEAGTERGDLFAGLDNAATVPTLQQLGEKMASKYSDQIQTFVDTFIFS